MDKLIAKEVIDKILNELVEIGIDLFKERVYTQRQVDGNPFLSLRNLIAIPPNLYQSKSATT